MTESEWLTCTDPGLMLDSLRGKASERKRRLFTVAVCRGLRGCLWDPAPVEAAERYADGLAGRAELEAARAAAIGTAGTLYRHMEAEDVEAGAALIRAVAATEAADSAALGVRAARAGAAVPAWHLLRCLFGTPFRPVAVDPAWLAWHGGAAVKLAAAVYEERELPSGHLDAARLAVLADMLAEAGATDPQLLGHLRSPGPHARGCAAVDALLGRA
jgi:hypothetical protein